MTHLSLIIVAAHVFAVLLSAAMSLRYRVEPVVAAGLASIPIGFLAVVLTDGEVNLFHIAAIFVVAWIATRFITGTRKGS